MYASTALPGRCFSTNVAADHRVADAQDTIKVTGVGTVSEVLLNTFMRDFQSVSGMGPLYSRWNAELGGLGNMAFHYASSSPWAMLPALHDWISSKGEFPSGSFHLKPFRFELFEPWGVDITLFNLFKDPTKYKVRAYWRSESSDVCSQLCLVGWDFCFSNRST